MADEQHSPREVRGEVRGEVRETEATREAEKKNDGKVVREKTCPFLLRVFCRVNGHHRPEAFVRNRLPIEDELQIHTWKDATLRELSSLVREVHEAARRRGVTLEFSEVVTERGGRQVLRELGRTVTGRRSDDDAKTLGELRFRIGSLISVAILTRPSGSGRPY